MRYQFVGKKTTFVGKTLWEIVGNLKNFGVGRLVKKYYHEEPDSSFFKIIRVLPLPPTKEEFENRRAMVWVDEIFRGRQLDTRIIVGPSEVARYQLIPKIEEEEYLNKAKDIKRPVKYIHKYCYVPPLYKKMWEEQNPKQEPLSKLKTVVTEYENYDVVVVDKTYEPNTCHLYKTNQTVDEMYKEMVRLKKIIKANKNVQQ